MYRNTSDSNEILSELTIVTPVYNDTKILNLFESLEQTPEFEFTKYLIIKNGSPNGVDELLKEFADHHQNCEIIFTPIKGDSSSRNLAIKNTRSKWILWLDSDLTIHKDFLFHLTQSIINNPDSEIIMPTLLYESGSNLFHQMNSNHFKRISERSINRALNNPGMMIQKAVYERIGGFNENIIKGNDHEIKIRIRHANIQVSHSNQAFLTHTADPPKKVITQHIGYGADRSTLTRLHPQLRKEIVADRTKAIIFFPKFVKNLKYGFGDACYEGFISFLSGFGFYQQELKYGILKSEQLIKNIL